MKTGTHPRSLWSLLLLPLFLLCLCTSAWPGKTRKLLALDQVQLWKAPPIDLGAILEADDADRAEEDGPYRVGFPVKAGLSPSNSGTWEVLAGGDRIWRLRVQSPGALWLALGFGTYRLHPGASLTISDPARRTVLGPFTSKDASEQGRLWLPPIAGETAVLELRWPRSLAAVQPNLHLGQVTHGYKSWGGIGEPALENDPAFSGQGGTSSFCNIDVNCPLGSAWQQQKLGVVQLLITTPSDTRACTGSLINNTYLDCRPLVLSAWHCFHPDPGVNFDPALTTFLFNYEFSGCNTGSAPSNQTLTGATQLAGNPDSDFILLELFQGPPANYSAYYNGWSRSTAPADNVWCIHHPQGAEKKISFSDDPVTSGSDLGLFTWRVADWEAGTTEVGSSGAPLFDPDKRIVGQLRGGNLSCESGPPFFEAFGKLDASWGWPGSAGVRLCDWLDPLHANLCATGGDTGVVTLDGLAPSFCTFPRPDLVRRGLIVDDNHGNHNGIPEPADRFKLRVELYNRGTLPATGVTGSLSTSHPGVTIPGAQATWSDISPVQTAFPNTPFKVELISELGCGEPINFNLSVSADQGQWNSVIALATATAQLNPILADDVESGLNGFASQSATGVGLSPNAWVQSTTLSSSPSHSWFVPDIAAKSDTRLVTPALGVMPQEPLLRFQHFIDTERDYDGGVLEYSTNGGGSWTDAGPLIRRGGYNSIISSLTGSPLANRSAWSGDLGSFQDVEVDLSSLAGLQVTLRWRFATDGSNADVGWYVDDIHLDSVEYLCAGPRRQPTPEARIPSGVH